MIPPSGIGSGCPWNIGNAKSIGRAEQQAAGGRVSGSGREVAAAGEAGAGEAAAAGAMAMAMAAAVAMADGPAIHVVPATPQDSQEKGEHPISTPPMLPPLHVSSSPPAADAAVSASAAMSIVSLQLPAMTDPSSQPCLSISPRHSPPPPQLRRSPRLLSPNPSGLRSRSTTPQPNPKKRVGASQDRAEAKRGRQE
jgi:hypothetical protein